MKLRDGPTQTLQGLATSLSAGLGSSLFPRLSQAAEPKKFVGGGLKRVIFFMQNQGFDPKTCIPAGMKNSGSLAGMKLTETIKPLEPLADSTRKRNLRLGRKRSNLQRPTRSSPGAMIQNSPSNSAITSAMAFPSSPARVRRSTSSTFGAVGGTLSHFLRDWLLATVIRLSSIWLSSFTWPSPLEEMKNLILLLIIGGTASKFLSSSGASLGYLEGISMSPQAAGAQFQLLPMSLGRLEKLYWKEILPRAVLASVTVSLCLLFWMRLAFSSSSSPFIFLTIFPIITTFY